MQVALELLDVVGMVGPIVTRAAALSGGRHNCYGVAQRGHGGQEPHGGVHRLMPPHRHRVCPGFLQPARPMSAIGG